MRLGMAATRSYLAKERKASVDSLRLKHERFLERHYASGDVPNLEVKLINPKVSRKRTMAKPDSPELFEQYRLEYEQYMHMMQSGVAALIERHRATDTSLKHLRTGINTAHADISSMASLLIDKGLITKLEYYKALRDGAKKEAELMQETIRQILGPQFTIMRKLEGI